MKRRHFLRNTALASTAWYVPKFLQDFERKSLYETRAGKILVVIQLSGGNDGLNTIVPFRNDLYYSGRPSLNIPAAEVLKLSDDLGLHPAMEGLQELFEAGHASIINSVGYPNPDRSHFRSMDIWHTASDSDEYLSSGWLGRYLDNQCKGCDTPHTALELDESLSLALKGAQHTGFAMTNVEQLQKTTQNAFLQNLGNQGVHQEQEQVAYLYKTMIETQQSASYLYEQSKVHSSKTTYPLSEFGKNLKQVAELITADTDTRIYYVSLSGFDTHAMQKNVQQRLLKQYADGVYAFVQDLKQHGLFNDVMILTFSEFGRRVKQNGSGGTDHGTANNVFLLNGNLKKPGFYNAAPNLKDLDDGDLKYEIDFRSIYATLLEQWLDADASTILRGNYGKLKLI